MINSFLIIFSSVKQKILPVVIAIIKKQTFERMLKNCTLLTNHYLYRLLID